jgi:hypothetical protein
MISPEQRKYFEKLIYRTNQEVLEVMKKIPEGELFSRNDKITLVIKGKARVGMSTMGMKFPKEEK